VAVISPDDLAAMRRQLAADAVDTGTRLKATWSLAYQAIEDWFSSAATQNAISNAIDAATTPVVIPNPEKRKLVKWWLRNRADRGN
jgi:hypothetical protein